MLNINEYQNKCLRTFNQSKEVGDNILQCLLGIQGESGEVIDLFKKHFYQGHDLDENKVSEEIGDVMWYISNLCNSLELDLSEILNQNIQKLQKRFPDGFSSEDSIKRVDTKEVHRKFDFLDTTIKVYKDGSKEEVKHKYCKEHGFRLPCLYCKKDEPYKKTSPTKPSYYHKGISPFDYIKSNNLDFFEGNVIKYITRYQDKNGKEDLLKAKEYLETIIKNYSKMNNKPIDMEGI